MTSKLQNLYFTPQLLGKLNDILEYPLTVVEAPMGYGKTTAVKEFLAKIKVKTLWLRVYDDSVEIFWKGFASLFSGLDRELSKNLSRLGVPDDSLLLCETMKLIGSMTLCTETVIVIDDYHLLVSPEVDRLISMIAENEFDNLHVVLIMRFSHFQRLEELSLKGLLHHLTKESFEFSPKEIGEYYKACGVIVDEKQSSELYSITEGWISALYLMLKEYTANGNLEPSENIYKLIGKAIYMPLSNQAKEFILAMSIFDNFTLKQAESMWGYEDTAKSLRDTINKNAFVSYDGKSKIYHIHALFREYLQDILGREKPEKRNALYRKAAEWYLKTGDYGTARQFFYMCGDFEDILCSIELETAKNFTPENKDRLKKYIGECPKDIKDRHPYALLIFTIHLFMHNELDLFYQICKDIESNLQGNVNFTEENKKQLLGEVELQYGALAFNDLKKMSCRFNRAWDLLGHSTTIYEDLTDWNMGSPSILCLYHRQSGKLKEEVHDIIETMPCYDRLTNGHASGGEYMMEAEWYFNMGAFDDADISLRKAVGRAQVAERINILLCAMFLQIRLAFIRGDSEGVFVIMEQMGRRIEETSKYRSLQMLELCKLFINSYLDKKINITKILDPSEGWGSSLRYFTLPIFNIAYGRVLLNSGEYLKLIGSADQFLSVASAIPNLLGTVYIYIYLAAANYRIFREDEAREYLKKALDLALPDKLYMPFVENGDYIGSLLEEMLLGASGNKDIANILVLYNTYANAKEKVMKAYLEMDTPSLTDREMEVARLAAEGATNKEIARQLFISVNTVKTILKSVYSKLSINSRALIKQHIDE